MFTQLPIHCCIKTASLLKYFYFCRLGDLKIQKEFAFQNIFAKYYAWTARARPAEHSHCNGLGG